MRADPGLAETQRWLQAAIMEPAAVPPRGATARVLPSRTLDPAARIDIYRGMYTLRLQEALRVDYPLLAACLGDDLFDELADLYIRTNPSRSYTLNRLGDRLPGFLSEVQGLPRPAFTADLARYELALTEVFDAPETPPATEADLRAVPAQKWQTARLLPVGAFRLLTLRHPVAKYATQVRDGAKPAPPHWKTTWTVVYRRAYAIQVMDLTRKAFAILETLAEGRSLGEAIEENQADPGKLFEWFQHWVSAGLFQRIHW